MIQYIVDKKPEDETLIFHYDERYRGDYKWEFPYNRKTKVGYPLVRGVIFKPDCEYLSKQTRAVGYGGLERYVEGRILLVGDAACQTNPITKGGIRPAMIAGKMAAKAVVNEDPISYQKEWLKTGFSNNIYLEAFVILARMNNEELKEHIEPFAFSNKYLAYLKSLLFHRKYLKLYNAYALCEKFGW